MICIKDMYRGAVTSVRIVCGATFEFLVGDPMPVSENNQQIILQGNVLG